MSKKIYISPSSQPENKYAVGNTNEEVQCNKIAAAVAVALERCGMNGILPSSKDTTMYDRARESNAAHVDLHMPIHSNAYNGKVAGLRIFLYKLGGEAEKIARAIEAELAPITPGESDGISAVPGLYEIKSTNAVCVYLEVGFHDNPEEAQWIIDHTEDIAEAICKGLCNYYGVKYVSPVPEKADVLYRVQIGAFSVKENAESMLFKAKAAGFNDAFITEVKK